jgi:hypothetical protein
MNEQPPTTRTAFSGALFLARRMLGPMLRPQVATTLVVVAWLVAIFTVAAISLPLPQVGFAQDVGVMLDAGWRYFQGLRTHADYHSPLGPLFAIIFGLPMKIAGPTYASYKLLPPVVTGIFTAWTIAVCTGSSLHPIVRASLAAGVAAAAGGLFHLGFPVEALSFAVFYNRIGFALLCIIGLAALLPRDAVKMPRWVAPARDASIAAASVMLFFLKVNFFFAALPFWLASAFLHRRTRGHVLAFGAALVGTSLFFLNEIGFRLDRMLGDLHMAADARRACLDSFFFPLRNAASNHDFGILLALSTLAYGTALRGSALPFRILAALTAILWAPALLGFALTLMQSHGDGRGIPLVLVGMASCLAWAAALSNADHTLMMGGSEVRLRNTRALLQARILGGACLVCAAALFVVPHAYSYAYLLDVSRNAGPRQFIGAGIRDLYIGAYGNNLEPGAVIKMNDASQLLARHARPGDSLQYMDMNNIYTFANHLRSPRKSMLFWDNRSSYTAASHPPASDFSDTDLLMAPKQQLTASPLETEWWSIYAYAIEDEYDLVEETNFFRLWRRTAKP